MPANVSLTKRGADGEQQTRSEAIDEQPLARREERLDDDEDRESDLNLRKRRAGRGHQRLREERPHVLRARDDEHADEPEQQLNPPRAHHRIGSGIAAPSFRGSEPP